MSGKPGKTSLPAPVAGPTPLVIRTAVPDGLPYNDYRHYLRRDFLYSCAYCTIAESEASAIKFTIDHYEPKNARADLINTYSNLMYACNSCNLYKGDRVPSDTARAAGIRYFRPDTDRRSEHFNLNGLRIDGQTEIGNFTVLAVYLKSATFAQIERNKKKID